MAEEGYFHHVVREVAELDRSERFYRDTLQLESLGRDLWAGDTPNATFRINGQQFIVLVEVPEVGPEEPAIHTNFMLSPEAFHKVHERLKAAGALSIDHRPERRSEGELSAYFYDPDRHRFQMTAYTQEVFEVPAARRGKVTAGRIEDFAIGSVTYVPEGEFFLVRLGDGVVAISEVCTHRHCSVSYRPEHYHFACPCHFNKYTRTGRLIGHNPCPPLHTYRIEFIDGQIVVDTDVSIARTEDEVDRLVPIPSATA